MWKHGRRDPWSIVRVPDVAIEQEEEKGGQGNAVTFDFQTVSPPGLT
jgi:hypothetical protein